MHLTIQPVDESPALPRAEARRAVHQSPLPRGNVCRWVSLMYHEVVPAADSPCDHWALAATSFAAQLDWLQEHGYRAESLERAILDPSPRTIAITFDDGYIGQYEHGFRLLAERGMRATFFVTTDWVNRPGFVTWDGLREMSKAGMSVQSHTVTHPFLSTLDEAGVSRELRESKRVLDRELAQDTTSLSLPGGDFPKERLRPLVTAAGYRIVATSEPGINEVSGQGNLAWVDRLTVRGGQPFGRFCRQVAQDKRFLVSARAKYTTLNLARWLLGREQYHFWRGRIEHSVPAVIRLFGA